MKRITFAVAPQEIGQSYNTASFWSVGPLRIISMLKHPEQHRLYSSLGINKNEEFDIKFLDGELEEKGLPALLEKVQTDVDILAIHNPSSYSYRNALEIAKRGRELGIKNIALGGHHVNYLSEQVLMNHPEINAVFTGRGEIGFLKYCLGYLFPQIDNLTYREGDLIKKTSKSDPVIERYKDFAQKTSQHPLHPDNIPPYDYSYLDLEKYSQNFQNCYAPVYAQRFPEMKRAMIEFTHEGCVWRETSGGCKFCALPVAGMIYRNPKVFWERLESDVSTLDVQLVKDYGDCLTGNESYLKMLAETKPDSLQNLHFDAYVKANEVLRGNTAKYLKQLGIVGALIGLEAGSSQILKQMRKGSSKEINRRALETLINNDVTPFCSAILGSAGETIESLDESLQFFKELGTEFSLGMVGANPISVFPGSPDWNNLTTYHMHLLNKYGVNRSNLDMVKMDQSRSAYLEAFSPELVKQCGGVERTYEVLLKYSREIQSYGKIGSHLGWEE